MRHASSMIELVNPDKDKIVQALAEVWRIHLEAETGRRIRVTIEKEKQDAERTGEQTA